MQDFLNGIVDLIPINTDIGTRYITNTVAVKLGINYNSYIYLKIDGVVYKDPQITLCINFMNYTVFDEIDKCDYTTIPIYQLEKLPECLVIIYYINSIKATESRSYKRFKIAVIDTIIYCVKVMRIITHAHMWHQINTLGLANLKVPPPYFPVYFSENPDNTTVSIINCNHYSYTKSLKCEDPTYMKIPKFGPECALVVQSLLDNDALTIYEGLSICDIFTNGISSLKSILI
jgi:hypothetical protein